MKNNNNPFKCVLCDKSAYKNANGIVRHILNKHKKISIEEYFMKHITKEMLAITATRKISNSELPIEWRLTDKCFECGEYKCKLQSFGKGFSVFCSEKCSGKNSIQREITGRLGRKGMKEKYGVEFASQIPGYKEKVEKTSMEVYGTRWPSQSEIIIQKHKQTSLERYNETSYTKTEEYKEKVRQTSIKKYNVEHFMQAPSVKNKIKETTKERYGVEHYTQTNEYRKRHEKTCMKLYNVKNVLQLPKTRKASAAAISKKFEKRILKHIFENVTLIDLKERLFKCNRCNNIFQQKNIGLSKGNPQKYPRCKTCYPIGKQNKISLFHQEVYNFLLTIGCKRNDIIENDKSLCKSINKEIDIYIPSKNIAIELNGNYYHTEEIGNKDKDYHLDKTDCCESNNVQLFHIFQDEWYKKTSIVKSILETAFNKNYNINCFNDIKNNFYVKSINSDICNKFLKLNHIKGTENYSDLKLSLNKREDDRLVSVMTFKQIKNNLDEVIGENVWKLVRFATDISTTANINNYDNIFSYFILKYKPDTVFSYADRRWESIICNNVYQMLGFVNSSLIAPNYSYVSAKASYLLREESFKYRKSNLKNLFPNTYNENLSEWENMIENGYDRIWDCGLIKYVWTK